MYELERSWVDDLVRHMDSIDEVKESRSQTAGGALGILRSQSSCRHYGRECA